MSLPLPRGPSTRTVVAGARGVRCGCECDGFHRPGPGHGQPASTARVFYLAPRRGPQAEAGTACGWGRAGGRPRATTTCRLARALIRLPDSPPAALNVQGLPLLPPPRGWQGVMARLADRTAGWAGSIFWPEFGGWQRILERYARQGFGRVRGGFTAGTARRLACRGCTDRYESPARTRKRQRRERYNDLKHRFKTSGPVTRCIFDLTRLPPLLVCLYCGMVWRLTSNIIV